MHFVFCSIFYLSLCVFICVYVSFGGSFDMSFQQHLQASTMTYATTACVAVALNQVDLAALDDKNRDHQAGPKQVFWVFWSGPV